MVSHVAMEEAWTEGMESQLGPPEVLPRSGLADTLPQFGCASGWPGSEDVKVLPLARCTEGLVGLRW